MPRNIAQIIGIAALLVLGSSHSTNVDKYRVTTVAIDAGHGGRDAGSCGRRSKEKDISLKIVLALDAILKRHMPSLKVVLTRSRDQFVPLWRRGYIANKNGAQVFISIHCNASKSKKVKGLEAFLIGPSTDLELNNRNYKYNLEVAKRENSVISLERDYEKTYQGYDPNSPESHILFLLTQNAYNDNSIKLAQAMQHQFEQLPGLTWRRIGQSPLIALARASRAVAKVLVEVGFITNNQEERYLNSRVGQKKIAYSLYKALREYKKSLEAGK